MKIIFTTETFYPPTSGADLSTFTLFKELGKEHDITAFFFGDKTKINRIDNINLVSIRSGLEDKKTLGLLRIFLLNKKFKRLFDRCVREKQPDFIITQGNLALSTCGVAEKYKIPVFIFIRGYEQICSSCFDNIDKPEKHNCLKHADLKQKIQYPLFKILSKWYKNVLENAHLILPNSTFTQRVIKNWYGLPTKIVYPFVKLDDYKVKKKKYEYITLVDPNIWKGVDIFLELADKFPNKKFLAVGRADKIDELKKRDNIKYISWTNDMRKIYSVTKILLIPSIYSEPIPRVAFEAMTNGIPCIVSNRGGLKEAVDDVGIVIDDIFNINIWMKVIEKLEGDKKFYKNYQKSL